MSATDKKIGVFDSGHGGLSLVESLFETQARIHLDYFADLEFHPYGARNDAEVLQRSRVITQKLLERGAELILVACNTATAVAIDSLRDEFDVPFVGIEPYLNLFEKQAIPKQEAYVLITPLMASSQRFEDLRQRRDPEGHIKEFVCPGLASLVEEGLLKGLNRELEQKVQAELKALKDLKPKVLILGCTHYPFVKDWIEKYTGAQCYSPCAFVAQRVLKLLELKPLGHEIHALCQEKFYYSSSLSKKFVLKNMKSDFSAWPKRLTSI